jgi:hypothetical protein
MSKWPKKTQDQIKHRQPLSPCPTSAETETGI